VYNRPVASRGPSLALPGRSAYNAEMGTMAAAEIDAWLSEGGLVVAASERAARALQAAFHRRRRAEGLSAWPTPNILDWKRFACQVWDELVPADKLLLNPAQERALWTGILRDGQHLPTAVPASLHRMAGMAMDAHELLCSYAPKFLREAARPGWDQDAGAFSSWLADFDRLCAKDGLESPSRALQELIPLLQTGPGARAPVLAVAFDRMLPVQRDLFSAWGDWRPATTGPAAAQIQFHKAADELSELEACAFWCNREISANPQTRILVISQEIAQRRGEIERAFLRFSKPSTTPPFEFSLGIPLTQVPLARGAHLLLRWLDGPLDENEVDWLLASGVAAGTEETAALQAYVRALRQCGLQRTHWTLTTFVDQPTDPIRPPSPWVQRMLDARRRLREFNRKAQTPLDWADKVPQLLEGIGWLGVRSQTSAEFQALRSWQQALDTVGSVGFDGRRIGWKDFLDELALTLGESLYAPQSLDAPIQIAGPAESAGLTADAIWFLGADEESWPAIGSTHPFLPIHVQREAGMPHTSVQNDWDLSSNITHRILASAVEVHFSFAAQKQGVEMQPSRLIAKLAGQPHPLPADLVPPAPDLPTTISYSDAGQVPFELENAVGGSSVLTFQSQCPFRAFATARLGARDWDPAEDGLTAAQRGQLLHAVLHAVWAGPPDGLGSLADLRNKQDVAGFVRGHVRNILQHEVPASVRDHMPARYLELEETRLTGVVTEWLKYESARVDFKVAGTEVKRTIHVDGLTLNLRLDRIDELRDGSLLVVDYKTGIVSPRSWDLPRPEDVQLPLYKLFGLGGLSQPANVQSDSPDPAPTVSGGVVFAKVRTGEHAFVGRVAKPVETIFADLKGSSSLVKNKLTEAQEAEWRAEIQRLATDFVAGRADVNPRDYPRTCEHCGLEAICRIREQEDLLSPDDEANVPDEAGDE
jgi:ATP-dependent helicase/nuclease subunit B